MSLPTLDELAGAPCVLLGDEWGSPLWRLEGDGWSVDAHGATEEEARAAAAEACAPVVQPELEPPVTRAELVAAITAAVPGADAGVLEQRMDAAENRERMIAPLRTDPQQVAPDTAPPGS
jgi:hypothetical protein